MSDWMDLGGDGTSSGDDIRTKMAVKRGMNMLRDKDIDGAIDHFSDLVSDNPDKATPHVGLGVALLRNGDAEDALTCFHRAVEIDSENTSALVFAGATYEKLQDKESAAAAYEEALAIDPSLRMVAARLTILLAKSKDYSRVEESLRRSLEFNPEMVGARLMLARNYDAQGRTDDAVRELEAAAEASPDSGFVKLRLARSLLTAGRAAEAKEWIEKSLEGSPERAGPIFLLGRANASLGDLEGARDAFSEANSLIPNNDTIEIELAVVEGRLGESEKALASLQKIARRNPRSPRIHKALADTYATMNRWDDAHQSLRAVFVQESGLSEAKPESAAALDNAEADRKEVVTEVLADLQNHEFSRPSSRALGQKLRQRLKLGGRNRGRGMFRRRAEAAAE